MVIPRLHRFIPASGRRTRRTVLALVASVVLSGGANTPGLIPPAIETTSLTTPSGTRVRAEIGHLSVPENRTAATGKMIDLAFMRVKSGKKGTAHVLLAGGPGASGIDGLKDLVTRGGEPLLELFDGDLLAVDQRGTGLSRPNLRSSALYHFSVEDAGQSAEYLAKIEATCRQVAADFRARGVDLAAYNTVESADDLDTLRHALGYEKLTLWGRSYGSHLALATLRRHEKSIDRVILCSPEGPDHTLKRPRDMQLTLEHLATLVKRDPVLGPRLPDLLATMRTVLDRLEKEPAAVETTHPLTGARVTVRISKFDIQRLTAQSVGNVPRMQALPAAYLKMANGDFQEMARVLLLTRAGEGVGSAMKFMMDCSSGASAARRELIAREAVGTLLGDTMNFPYPGIAPAWGNPDLGDAFRAPIQSTVPVLFICGDLDGRTPVSNARDLMNGLPRSELLVVENAGHDFNFFGNPELRWALAKFLKGEPLGSTRVRLPPLVFSGVP